MILKILLSVLLLIASVLAEDKVYPIIKVSPDDTGGDNSVKHPCLMPNTGETIIPGINRDKSWSLPDKALDANQAVVIKVLVLRFNFQEELPDDPNTTGDGMMDLYDPFATPEDSAAYYDMVGHWIDPPPHDSFYYDAHLQALSRYYETVSEGKITLSWDIFPPAKDSVYTLPEPMNYYGKCEGDSVITGLERYFIDCIKLADSASPEIRFDDYQSIFLFHAGSDRQNDIGFPETCNDLFTGFILFGDSIGVDFNTHYVRSALMMPETASQDNRATALNAVIAHEFGHQLGLVDIYSTRSFLSQLGDFALMDNNGFGTGIDFGFDVGRVFGAIPLYPCAWSRAYLGFVDVHDFRKGTDIKIAAAEMITDSIKIARIPISENEYYLIENRLIEVDGKETGIRADARTGVIQGTVEILRDELGNIIGYGDYTTEYDNLIPGSGLLVLHVDESVAGLDWDNDGLNNFDDNDLQWISDQRFISLVEADGLVHLGGYYRSGYGRAEDLFRDDRNTSFTPNTNPPAIDNTGNNTHVYMTDISRVADTFGIDITLDDHFIRFDLETDKLVPGFPVRVGYPDFGLAPICDDLNKDGTDEIICASGTQVLVFTTEGENYLRKFYSDPSAPLFYDVALSSIDTGKQYAIPLFLRFRYNQPVYAGPVTGYFGIDTTGEKLVAVGIPTPDIATDGQVLIYKPVDDDNDGQADYTSFFITVGSPIAMTFGDKINVLTDSGIVYEKLTITPIQKTILGRLPNEEYHGICKIGAAVILLAGDSDATTIYALYNDQIDSLQLIGHYRYGPISADMNRDGIFEVAAVTDDGDIALVSVDLDPLTLSIYKTLASGYSTTANPIFADIDVDGYPDLIFGGLNHICAYNRELTLITDFPKQIDDRSFSNNVISSPIVSDIEDGGKVEIIFPTDIGNIYSLGDGISYGFPMSGGEIGVGPSLVLSDSLGGYFGYLGADGWFYLWQADFDNTDNYWPMGGSDASGSLSLTEEKLGDPKQYSSSFDDSKFYNYPNPVTNGSTTIRYFLGQEAEKVEFRIYDLSGVEVDVFNGTTQGGLDNEVVWNCSDVVPGVYRCMINVKMSGSESKAFTDIAVIR
ncbi:MAG: hypothetical protein ABIJ12_11800 [bacterium]